MDSYIGYSNLLELTAGTVTASSEAAGYAKENAFDWLTHDFWKPSSVTAYLNLDAGSSVTADYFAVAAHDLGDNAATIGLEYADDSGYSVNLTDAFTPVAPSNNKPIFRAFTSVSRRYWRVKITGAVASLGVVSFGDRLELPRGIAAPFDLITESRESKVLNSKTEGGQFVGRSIIRQGASGSLQLQALTEAWIRSNWPNLSAHMESKPFFLQWDNANYPNETALIWLQGEPPTPKYTDPLYLSVSLKFNGMVR